MSRAKAYLVFCICLFFNNTEAGQVSVEKNAPQKASLREWTRFRTFHGKEWRVRWNKDGDIPESCYGFKTQKSIGAPGELCKNFLLKHKSLFKIDFSNLKEKEIVERMGNNHVVFQQVYKNLPVEGCFVNVHMTDDGEIYSVDSQYNTDVEIDTVPTISQEEAVNITTADLGETINIISGPYSELVIYPADDNNNYLCWKVMLSTKNPPGDWYYFINALNGEILKKYNDIRY